LIHGLNRHYYSLAISFRKTELEQTMLLNLHKRSWIEGLKLRDFEDHKHRNEEAIKVRSEALFSQITPLLTRLFFQQMLSLAGAYNKSVQEESTLTPEQLKTRHVGKQDPKRHLEDAVESAMGDQICQSLASMLLLACT
jgi:26S proteasome regulatory subunit N11